MYEHTHRTHQRKSAPCWEEIPDPGGLSNLAGKSRIRLNLKFKNQPTKTQKREGKKENYIADNADCN